MMPENMLKAESVMQDHVMREIKPQSEALGALQALSKTGGLSQEKVTQSSGKPGSPGSGDGSCCQSCVTFGQMCPGALQGEGLVGRWAR